jgi:hypothetical protein
MPGMAESYHLGALGAVMLTLKRQVSDVPSLKVAEDAPGGQ